MDTKWKNTDVKKKSGIWIRKIINRKEFRLLPGAGGCILGIFLLMDLYYSHYLTTKYALTRGFFLNLSLGIGLWGSIGFLLYFQTRAWQPVYEEFYQEWKEKLRKQQIYLCVLAAMLLGAAVKYFDYMCQYYWRFANYSTGYVMVGTVIVQWIVCEIMILSFMKQKLDNYMEAMGQINQKNLEAALRSEQMKVDLISNVSHDLKTPLTSMVGYLELMKKEELTDVLSDYTEVLSRKAQKLKEMIDSLFDLAKTSSGNVELKMEPMEMNRLIEQVQADMEDRIRDSHRELVLILSKEDTSFIADSSYMYRICQNLLENALKYSMENTRVFLKTAVRAETDLSKKVRFEITNTAGYPMEFTNDQIVERFVRGDESRTTDGNGLGLAIVNTYTAALGGNFEVNIDCDQFKAIVEFLK